jgi:hypothetical protein
VLWRRARAQTSSDSQGYAHVSHAAHILRGGALGQAAAQESKGVGGGGAAVFKDLKCESVCVRACGVERES